MLGERIDQRGEAHAVFQQGGDVVEEDSRFGEVGYFANQLLQVFTTASFTGCHLYHAPSMRKVVSPSSGWAGRSRTSSTRAARGPWRSFRPSAASCSSEPMASTSTEPSTL